VRTWLLGVCLLLDDHADTAVVGAVCSGAIFGGHASPIADTTALSATFTGAAPVDPGRFIRFIVSQYRWIAETGGRSTGEQLQ
jgi:Na+/H+ antiporter NhaC